MDTFSNILYVKEAKRALSALAHKCVSIDKYRPESCCVIGNYYSLKGAHEKAVVYFRRALKLDGAADRRRESAEAARINPPPARAQATSSRRGP